jgi:hypothetical protein
MQVCHKANLGLRFGYFVCANDGGNFVRVGFQLQLSYHSFNQILHSCLCYQSK